MPKTTKSLSGILEKAFCPLYNTDSIVSMEQHNKAVTQAKSSILALLDGLEHKEHILTTDEMIFNQGVQAARERLEE